MKKFGIFTKPLNWFIASIMVAFVVGCGSSILGGENSNLVVSNNPTKAITAYSFVEYPSAPGVINETAKTIDVTLPSGSSITSLTATYSTVAPSVTIGAVVQTSGAAPTNDFTLPVTYRVTAADTTFVDYVVTVTVTPALSSLKTITAFSFVGFPSAPVVIDEALKTIAVTLPSGTAVTALTANFTTVASSVKIGATVQNSGAAPSNDFTLPVTYRVTAADASFVDYVVTVTIASASTKTITAFSFVGFPSAPVVIDEALKTIAVTLPSGTVVTALTANFTTVASSVKIGATVQNSGAAPSNDFTFPVTYRVTAADASFVDYVVTVTVNPSGTVLPGVAGTSGLYNATNPTVIASNPSNGDTNVPTSTQGSGNIPTTKLITATFDEAMDPATILLPGTFTLYNNTLGATVPGAVSINTANTIATFTSTAATLNQSTSYTATITTAAKNAGSITAMPKAVAWSFTTVGSTFIGQAPVNLLTAGNFVILSETGITEANPSLGAITGNVGTSPITGAAMTIECPEVTGVIYSVDATGPACKVTDPIRLTAAIGDKNTAYNEAAARATPDATELGAGNISGLTIYPGLYKWSSSVNINTDVTLDAKGDANAVWIFQIAGDLTIASGGTLPTGIKVNLIGGAKAANVFWQVGGGIGATLNTYSTFNGNILSIKEVILKTGAVLNGRALAATQVTLEGNRVTQPAP
jgi:hypothetical protein